MTVLDAELFYKVDVSPQISLSLTHSQPCMLLDTMCILYVTGYAKRDHIPHFIKIVLLTPLECAICGEWNGTIDALI